MRRLRGCGINTRDAKHLNRAIEVSKQSTCRQKHGVVIARGAKVIAVAVNTDRNNPSQCSNPKHEASFHAEVNAIKQIKSSDLSNAVLYSARTNNDGEPMNAKPCLRCQAVIEFLNIKKVIHT